METKNEEKKDFIVMNIWFNDESGMCIEGAIPRIDEDILAVQLEKNYKISGTMYTDVPDDIKYFTMYFPLTSIKFWNMYKRELTDQFISECKPNNQEDEING